MHYVADDLHQFALDADANMRFYCDGLLRLAATEAQIKAIRIGPSAKGVSDHVVMPHKNGDPVPIDLEVAALLDDGNWYALASPELQFREAVLHYVFTEHHIDLDGPIRGQIEVPHPAGATTFEVTGASHEDAILLTRQ